MKRSKLSVEEFIYMLVFIQGKSFKKNQEYERF